MFKEKLYGIIYKTTNLINGKIYIGQTTKMNDKNYIGGGVLIKKAIKEYGKNFFLRETLDIAKSKNELDDKEKSWIKKLNPEYNIELGGGGLGKMSEETKEKIRQSNLGKDGYWAGKKRPDISLRMSGDNSPTKRPEVREKLSKIAKHRFTDKINHPSYGKHRSEETKEKISKANTGKVRTPAMKQNMSNALKGKNNGMYGRSVYDVWLEKYGKEEADVRQKELNEKRSNSGEKNGMYGNHHSEETKKIQSKKMKLYWENKKKENK